MKLVFKKKIKRPLVEIEGKLDKDFFKEMLPDHSPIGLLKYDGTFSGGKYSIGLKSPLNFPVWEGQIIDAGRVSDKEYAFTEKASNTPVFMKNWKHVHRFVETARKNTIIVDEVEFNCSNPTLEKAMSVVLMGYFYYRQMKYSKLLS